MRKGSQKIDTDKLGRDLTLHNTTQEKKTTKVNSKTPESQLEDVVVNWSSVSATGLEDNFGLLNQVLLSELISTAVNLYDCSKNQKSIETRKEFIRSKLDNLIEIWNEILPKRNISLVQISFQLFLQAPMLSIHLLN